MNIESKFFSKNFICQECLKVDFVLSETDTFEEIPILSRVTQLNAWRTFYGEKDVLVPLLGVAFFLLCHYRYVQNIKNDQKNFLCLTIQWMEVNENELIPYPSIFTSTTVSKNFFLEKIDESIKTEKSLELRMVENAFMACGFFNSFSFYESRFFDESSQSEIIRIYCI